MKETWDSRAVPIMRVIADHEGIGEVLIIGSIAQESALEADAVAIELSRLLQAGYVQGELAFVMGGLEHGHLSSPMLSERGARAVGVWPSDDPYEALLALIERQLAEENDDETKTKLQKLRGTLGEIGKGTASGLLVALVQASAHLR